MQVGVGMVVGSSGGAVDTGPLPEDAVPVPTGLAPLDSRPHMAVEENIQLFMEFEATQAEPPLENLFLAKGGTLAAAAARAVTDFALTGSTTATPVHLSDAYATVVRIPLPTSMATPSNERAMTLDIDNRSKLLVCGMRDGAAINGTIVSSLAGQGAVYLANFFRSAAGNSVVPLTYANWIAHSSVVAASDMRIVDQHGRRFDLNFVENPERDVVLKHAEEFVGKWAEGAWNMRTGDDGLKYKYSPTLTKCVSKQPVGINDTGYDLVHNVLETSVGYSWHTINSLLKNAIEVDLEFMPEDIAHFIGDTAQPGLKAAGWARTLGAALSMIAATLMSYRADGRTRITPNGSEAVAAEQWQRRAHGPLDGDDCDGSMRLTQRIANMVAKAPIEVMAEHEYVRSAHHIVHPYYTVGGCVLGASGASAETSEASTREQSLAGHAATLMIPSLSLLRALDKGSSATVGGVPVVESGRREEVATARLNALFDSATLGLLPKAERTALGAWSTAREFAKELQAYGVEGTTPASPILSATGEQATEAETNAKNDTAAFAKTAPNVGRSIKILHRGGADPQNPHKFYHDFVEFTVPRGHGLWSSEHVRATECASTQFVFAKEPNRVSGALTSAGTSPRDLVREAYTAVPLVVANGDTASVIDYASEQADLDVMPPRTATTLLTAFQSQQLKRSLAALATLDDAFKTDNESDGHPVAYILAYNTLVNNPAAVEHMCSRLKAVAVSGMVDSLDIDGMATSEDGMEAGKMVVINALIPLS